jgi:hypothetical protein
MAIIQSYPTGTPKTGDYLIGTSMPAVNSDELPVTKNFPIANVLDLAPSSVAGKTAYIASWTQSGSTPEIQCQLKYLTIQGLHSLGQE